MISFDCGILDSKTKKRKVFIVHYSETDSLSICNWTHWKNDASLRKIKETVKGTAVYGFPENTKCWHCQQVTEVGILIEPAPKKRGSPSVLKMVKNTI